MSENRYDYKDLTPFKWFVLENFPFIEADFDALTNWQLFCKLGKQMNKVIDSQNTVGNAVEEYTDKFIALKKFVDEFFANLDVQDEIDNKLNEMAQSGQLQDILLNYTSVSKVYNTYYYMIQDINNLVNGMKVRTLGYHSINDGGGCEYYITNQENTDKYQIQLNQTGLYAELIIKDGTVNPFQFGCYGDNNNDDTEKFQEMINFCVEKFIKIVIPSTSFLLNKIEINGDITIEGNGSESILKLNNDLNENENFITFKNTTFLGILKNLKLSGNNHRCENSLSIEGANITVQNCIIYNFNGNGIQLIYGAFKSIIQNSTFRNLNGYGMKVLNTDSYFENIDVFYTKKHGILIEGSAGSNNKFVNCKTYFSGFRNSSELGVISASDSPEADGWYINASNNHRTFTNNFVNCEAQETGRNGITILNVIGGSFSNCLFDSGNILDDDGVGVKILNSSFLNFNGEITNKKGLRGKFITGIECSGCFNSNIDVYINTIYQQTSDLISSFTENFIFDRNPSVNLMINGNKLQNDYENYLNVGNEIPTDFNKQNAGDMVANYLIDPATKSQLINITQDYSNANSWVGLYKEFNLYNNPEKYGISVECKTTKSTGAFQNIRIEFYDSENTRISYRDVSLLPNNYPKTNPDVKLNWYISSILGDIPENTSKIRLILRVVSTQANNKAKFYFKNLKFIAFS